MPTSSFSPTASTRWSHEIGTAPAGESEGRRPRGQGNPLPARDKIEQRFNVSGDDGVVIEVRRDHRGYGRHRLHLHQRRIDVGRHRLHGRRLQAATGISPNQLLERIKRHPAIQPLLDGWEIKEYAAHLIPRGRLQRDAAAARRRLDDLRRCRPLRELAPPRRLEPRDDDGTDGRRNGRRASRRGEASMPPISAPTGARWRTATS